MLVQELNAQCTVQKAGDESGDLSSLNLFLADDIR
jgi:hypothetical protein